MPIKSESTVNDDIYAWPTLIELNNPSSADVVLAVSLLIWKLLANPVFVESPTVEILLAVKIPVLSNVVLKTGGTYDSPPPLVIPVKREPSPTKRPYTVPAEIVEKKPYVVDMVTAEILDTARR